MSSPPIHQTKSAAALQIIRSRILSGEYEAGEQLRAETLASELEMSATPVREALRMLQADRLVHHKPHHGIVVAGISPEETEEIYFVRSLLEAPAAELAVTNMDEETLTNLEEIHKKLTSKSASKSLQPVSFGALNAEWHWAIYHATGQPYLCEIIEELWERFPWRTMWAQPEDIEGSVHDHNEIMEAIRARDAKLTGERMRSHVLSGPARLLPGHQRASRD